MDFEFDESGNDLKTDRLKNAFLKLADNPAVGTRFPDIVRSAEQLRKCGLNNAADDEEIAFLNLYCAIHGAGSAYSQAERSRLDSKKGYFNHPGGISPLLKAESYINGDTIVADLGAGNGLQGLLFQYLYPHRRTMQIELSAEMIEIGQLFQNVLEIPNDRVEWINDDILNISLETMDFLYLYRPSKPMQNGIALYRDISAKLQRRNRALTIFSIADCLKDFLDERYSMFYTDGHLTCFQSRSGTAAGAQIDGQVQPKESMATE